MTCCDLMQFQAFLMIFIGIDVNSGNLGCLRCNNMYSDQFDVADFNSDNSFNQKCRFDMIFVVFVKKF